MRYRLVTYWLASSDILVLCLYYFIFSRYTSRVRTRRVAEGTSCGPLWSTRKKAQGASLRKILPNSCHILFFILLSSSHIFPPSLSSSQLLSTLQNISQLFLPFLIRLTSSHLFSPLLNFSLLFSTLLSSSHLFSMLLTSSHLFSPFLTSSRLSSHLLNSSDLHNS